MGKEVDPSDIGKHPDLIKKAQTEINKMDVLVCGNCNGVFHFIEQFREHKTIKCAKLSSLKDNLETKPLIWAFLLWKTSQIAEEKNKENTNAWKLYQQWVKLDEAIKETWIVAGRTIQSFARIGQGSLQEMPVKITKTVVDNSSEPAANRQLQHKVLTKSNSDLVKREQIINLDDVKTEKTLPVKTFTRTPQQKPSPVNRVGVKPSVIVRRAKRTIMNSANTAVTEEHTIEKILAKRFNPRHREHEYLIKWDNYTHDQNTWEPASHLDTCPVLLETFEKQLARQKEQRLALAAKQSQNESESATKPTIVRQVRPEPIADIAAKKRKIETAEKIIQPVTRPEDITTVYKTTTPRSNNVQSAEVVITNAKDGKPTGIVKKTGVTQRTNIQKEAQIRVIPKGGTEPSGVVRVTTDSQTNRPIGQRLGSTTVKTVQSRNQPAVTSRQVPSTAKPTITRVTKNQASPKQITPEQKIAALSRQGDLKITRRSVQSTPIAAQTTTIVQENEYNPQLVLNDGKNQNVFTNRILDQSEAEAILSGNQEYHIQTTVKKESEHDQNEQLQQIADIAANPEELQLLANENLIQFVTGDDGTIYQVAGKNEQGHTILIAQGTDSDQQCVYMTTDTDEAVLGVDESINSSKHSLDTSNALQQLEQVQGIANIGDESGIVALDDSSAQGEIQHIATADDLESQEGQITAEVVQADLPSPG